MAKGSQFERDICRQLSLWWSDGKHDDLFWRTSQSGGRATVRGRKGLGTRGHCGDICSTDSEGEPLTRLITFELKRGYNTATVHDLIDRAKKDRPKVYETWIAQAHAAAQRAGTPFWCIIHRRDKRLPTVTLPRSLILKLVGFGGTAEKDWPRPYTSGRLLVKHDTGWTFWNVVTMRLDYFLTGLSRKTVKSFLRRIERERT